MRGKLGLMGRAMLSKSLIQFSVNGRGCVPSLLFDPRPNYGGGHEDNGDNGDLLQKVPCLHCCSPTPLPETPGHLLASLGWSVLGSLGPGVHKVLFVPSKSLFLQSCVSSVGSVVGLMATSSKRAYAISRAAAPKPLPLQQPTADPYLHRRHPNTVLSQSLWGLWVLVHTKFV